jgi:hypothetical protein
MSMRSNRRRVREEVSLRVKAEMALKEAVAEAIAEHKRRGRPIVVWRNGKVVLVPPDEIVVPDFAIGDQRSKAKRSG